MSINNSNWRRDHFVEGIFHTAETIGTHYQLFFLNDKQEKEAVTLFRPQAPPIPLRHNAISNGKQFNVVVPLYQRIDGFKLFLENFEKFLVKSSYRIYLTIVYFGQSVKDLMQVFQPFILKHNYRSYHIEHVTDKNFSRGYALDYGIRKWRGKGDPILFLCDVDVVFSEEFMRRCDHYTIRQTQVYYPIVFSLYNPKVNHFGHMSFPICLSSLHGLKCLFMLHAVSMLIIAALFKTVEAILVHISGS